MNWLRGEADIIGQQGPAQVQDVGKCLGPNKDWWWHDTRHVSVSDVQARLSMYAEYRGHCTLLHTPCAMAVPKPKSATRMPTNLMAG